jgi:prolyl-tRNA synthetase
MLQSKLFVKTERNAPKDEITVNAQLLTRAGFVEKLMAGVYNYLPLGLLVLRKIEQIVREEMDRIGGQEVLMAMLHPKDIWVKTGQWKKLDVLFELESRTGKEYALGQSEEEVVTPLVMRRVHTYQDLPLAVYQIHWKFRDELRSKSGLLRGREFFMKDMYSFHEDQEDFEKFYVVAKQAYLKAFQRMGLVAKVTEGSGGSFSEKISYEFMVLSDAGEDNILFCDACEFCVNAAIAKRNEGSRCRACSHGKLAAARASEVGNVFDLGQKYGKDFDLGFIGRDGRKHYPVMGCYGIGISRLMGVIVEKSHDDRGIVWPASVAPLTVHLIELGGSPAKASSGATAGVSGRALYDDLQAHKVDVLYDERDVSAGEKLVDADLIGLPWRFVVSPKHGDKVEVKRRNEKTTNVVSRREAVRLVELRT